MTVGRIPENLRILRILRNPRNSQDSQTSWPDLRQENLEISAPPARARAPLPRTTHTSARAMFRSPPRLPPMRAHTATPPSDSEGVDLAACSIGATTALLRAHLNAAPVRDPRFSVDPTINPAHPQCLAHATKLATNPFKGTPAGLVRWEAWVASRWELGDAAAPTFDDGAAEGRINSIEGRIIGGEITRRNHGEITRKNHGEITWSDHGDISPDHHGDITTSASASASDVAVGRRRKNDAQARVAQLIADTRFVYNRTHTLPWAIFDAYATHTVPLALSPTIAHEPLEVAYVPIGVPSPADAVAIGAFAATRARKTDPRTGVSCVGPLWVTKLPCQPGGPPRTVFTALHAETDVPDAILAEAFISRFPELFLEFAGMAPYQIADLKYRVLSAKVCSHRIRLAETRNDMANTESLLETVQEEADDCTARVSELQDEEAVLLERGENLRDQVEFIGEEVRDLEEEASALFTKAHALKALWTQRRH